METNCLRPSFDSAFLSSESKSALLAGSARERDNVRDDLSNNTTQSRKPEDAGKALWAKQKAVPKWKLQLDDCFYTMQPTIPYLTRSSAQAESPRKPVPLRVCKARTFQPERFNLNLRQQMAELNTLRMELIIHVE